MSTKTYKDKYNGTQEDSRLRSIMRVGMSRDCAFEGEKDAMRKIFKEYFYDYYTNNYQPLVSALEDKHRVPFERYMIVRCSKGRYKYLLVTVAPSTDITYQNFKEKIDKALTKKWIVNSISCIEWTEAEQIRDGEFFNGNMHWHCRIEITKDKNPYRCRMEIYNTFKYMTKPQCVSVRYSNAADSFIKYVEGVKKGDVKQGTKISKLYRDYYKIPDVF